MKDRLATPKSVSDAMRNAEGRDEDAKRAARRERRRERASRRKTLESTTTGGDQPSDTVNITDADLLQKPRDSDPNLSRTESNLARTNSVSSTEGFLGGDTSLRVVSPPSVIFDMDRTTTTTARKLTSPIKFEPGSGSTTARESRLRSPESSQVSQTVKSPESTRESRVKSPDTVGSPPVRSPLSSRSQSRESGLCSPERPPSHPASRPRTPEHSTPARSRSPERPLSPPSTSRPLSPPPTSRPLSPDAGNQANNRVRSPDARRTTETTSNIDNNNNEDPNHSTCR